jgi:excisionase family DNA binding protein
MMVGCPVCGQETDFMTTAQVARVMGVATRTVVEWCHEGRFPGAEFISGVSELQARGVWRIPAASVLELIRERERVEPS